MERFYEQQLLNIAHKCPGYLQNARRFLCTEWKTVDANLIQKTEVENKFLVSSTRQNSLFYTVNTAIETCTCLIGINGAP
ncbi:6886_t:CDS:1, partial [Dentiscutata erythropus]